MKNIRNFSIIAHIDHGKSTLSDRIIEICGGLPDREMSKQILDSMDLERERGITIKAQNVTLNYQALNRKIYQLNLIDTPGHVDFSYEVSRSLAACEGALLLVDVSQGVEAQTIANYYMAIEMNLKIIIVLNKIDLPFFNLEQTVLEIQGLTGIDSSKILCCSAKTGIGVSDVLESIVSNIPAPEGSNNAPLQALIIDSWFDNYLGVVSLVRVKNGSIKKGSKIRAISTGCNYNVDRLGIFNPKQIDRTVLKCGEVGWLVCSIKNILNVLVGDTLTESLNQTVKPLPGFKKIPPQVYASIFPTNTCEYKSLCSAINKLSLNDSSLFYEPESSSSLGLGFRCGFLGLLHMEIVQERLEREYNLNLITTSPTVVYEIKTIKNELLYINNPSKLPPMHNIRELREPIAECNILSPDKYLGKIIAMCIKKRGIQTNIVYSGKQVALTFEIPMAEVISDFFNNLKSISHGYASVNYYFKRFQASKIVSINIMINGKSIDEFTILTHYDNALYRSKDLVMKIKEVIPRHQFDVIIQAVMNNHIIARSVVKQFCKNVTGKCYGGDITRKKKLLKKQKSGKKRMKKVGNVNLPQEAFLTVLNLTG